MASFCWSFLPAVSWSRAEVKYMKNIVWDEDDASFCFSISVVCFQVHQTATALWGLSHQRQAKVQGRKEHFENPHACLASLKNLQRRPQYNKIDLAQGAGGWRLFRNTDRACARGEREREREREHSLLATFLCLEELMINSATFLYYYYLFVLSIY